MSDQDDLAAIAAEHGWTVAPWENVPHAVAYRRTVTVPDDDPDGLALAAHGHTPTELLMVKFNHWGRAQEAAYFGFWEQHHQTGAHQRAVLHPTQARKAAVWVLTEHPDMLTRYAGN